MDIKKVVRRNTWIYFKWGIEKEIEYSGPMVKNSEVLRRVNVKRSILTAVFKRVKPNQTHPQGKNILNCTIIEGHVNGGGRRVQLLDDMKVA